jgi:hypothetical protein
VVLNRIYRHWTAGLSREQREQIDAELYAPEGGWEAAEERAFDRMRQWAAEIGDEPEGGE